MGLASQSQFADQIGGPDPQDILEKPLDKEDNMRMLLDLNGGRCEVVTGVTVGASVLVPSLFGLECRVRVLTRGRGQCSRCWRPRGTRSSESSA